ncbi:MAG: hypothetical protein FGM57_00650 [Candidatus Taylorbacteria bacterium]|nr:hypothetical protein [Candidatus Taylorbacteria bacterium]
MNGTKLSMKLILFVLFVLLFLGHLRAGDLREQIVGVYTLAPNGVIVGSKLIVGTIADDIDFDSRRKFPKVFFLIVTLVEDGPRRRVVSFVTQKIEERDSIKKADQFKIVPSGDGRDCEIIGTMGGEVVYRHRMFFSNPLPNSEPNNQQKNEEKKDPVPKKPRIRSSTGESALT